MHESKRWGNIQVYLRICSSSFLMQMESFDFLNKIFTEIRSDLFERSFPKCMIRGHLVFVREQEQPGNSA
jgi:hypothetical protein